MILGLLHFKINGVCLFYNQGINSPPPLLSSDFKDVHNTMGFKSSISFRP